MEWDESLAPICPNYTLIENAVYECAWAGCDTIWIVVNDDMAPLLRYRLGERIQDPIYVNNDFAKMPSIFQFFTPLSIQKTETRETVWLGLFFMVQ